MQWRGATNSTTISTSPTRRGCAPTPDTRQWAFTLDHICSTNLLRRAWPNGFRTQTYLDTYEDRFSGVGLRIWSQDQKIQCEGGGLDTIQQGVRPSWRCDAMQSEYDYIWRYIRWYIWFGPDKRQVLVIERLSECVTMLHTICSWNLHFATWWWKLSNRQLCRILNAAGVSHSATWSWTFHRKGVIKKLTKDLAYSTSDINTVVSHPYYLSSMITSNQEHWISLFSFWLTNRSFEDGTSSSAPKEWPSHSSSQSAKEKRTTVRTGTRIAKRALNGPSAKRNDSVSSSPQPLKTGSCLLTRAVQVSAARFRMRGPVSTKTQSRGWKRRLRRFHNICCDPVATVGTAFGSAVRVGSVRLWYTHFFGEEWNIIYCFKGRLMKLSKVGLWNYGLGRQACCLCYISQREIWMMTYSTLSIRISSVPIVYSDTCESQK